MARMLSECKLDVFDGVSSLWFKTVDDNVNDRRKVDSFMGSDFYQKLQKVHTLLFDYFTF